MNWEATGVIGSLAMSTLALAVSILGQRSADRNAERSVAAAERMATALEQQAVERERSAPIPGVVWKLEHHNGDVYMLTNTGRGTAYDVYVDTGDLADASRPATGRSKARAGDASAPGWARRQRALPRVPVGAVGSVSPGNGDRGVSRAERPGGHEGKAVVGPELVLVEVASHEVRDLVEKMLKSSGRRVDLSTPFVDAKSRLG